MIADARRRAAALPATARRKLAEENSPHLVYDE
jgi:hypothetical protein